MTKLSDTQRAILTGAAQHGVGLARAPKTLPAAARNAVFRSLIKNGLLTEISAPRDFIALGWRQDDDCTWIAARITEEGLRAVGIAPDEGDVVIDRTPTAWPEAALTDGGPELNHAAHPATLDAQEGQPQATAPTTPRIGLREAAQAMLLAWDASPAQDATDNPISRAIEALRASLGVRAIIKRTPRQGTKQQLVLDLLGKPEGATIAQVMAATGWAQHTVRGFFAGLKKKGHAIGVIERVRQVGPNNTGSRGSYSVYRIGGAA